eukprot:13170573-Alexandrium_andersonii.AAC.1
MARPQHVVYGFAPTLNMQAPPHKRNTLAHRHMRPHIHERKHSHAHIHTYTHGRMPTCALALAHMHPCTHAHLHICRLVHMHMTTRPTHGEIHNVTRPKCSGIGA